MHPAPDADLARQELIRRLGAGRRQAMTPAAPPIGRRAAGVIPPMTDEQKHVWLHALRLPDQPLYNEPITIHYRGAFSHALFLRSFDELLRRHEAWRTSFASLDDRPVQIVHDDVRADFPLVDLGDLPPARREEEALAMAAADAYLPFDLERAPLFRGRVVRFTDDEHRLYLTLHHIIFDGVSIYRVMMPELAAIYAAAAAGRDHRLPEPAVRYGDYAVWQAARAAAGTGRAQLDYWRRTLAGELPVLQLPVDRAAPPIPSGAGTMETFELAAPLVAELKELGRARGCTLYMVLLAAFKTLLHRYAGQDDIVIGGVTDTRRRPELQHMIGYCLNAMPLRSRPRADMPFAAFLRQVRDVTVGAIEHSDVAFEQVVRALDVRSSGHPIFDVLFSIEPPAPAFAPGWDLTQMDVPHGGAKFALYLELDERADGSMAARFMYSSELFDRETIVRMVGHWTTLLDGIVRAPDAPLGSLALLAEGEEVAILALAEGCRRELPATTVPGLVRQAAQHRPDAPAVRCGDERYSYRQLLGRVGALSARLRQIGVGRGDLVALAVSRSADMVAAALAIMERGAAYLPLDPTFPAARLTAIVADADPVAVVTQQALAGHLPGWGKPVLLCDGNFPAADDAGHAAPDDLAYVMYTSGSTGTPKGVEIGHRAVVNLLRSMQRAPGFTRDDVLLAVTTPTFDISVLEMFLPLISGGSVVVASGEEVVDPHRLRAAIDRSACTVMQATPATWRNLLAAGWEGVPGLTVLCGGEALPRDLADQILARGMALWNLYGPTETTIWSSVERVGEEGRITIGRPIDNTSIHVLDGHGRPQPVNVAGDLHIGGAGLARGYRDPELTARAFATMPGVAGRRLYRTGDVALMRRDGRFEWLGRSDGQVKVRGFRVDLGDVEAALDAHPAIAMAAVRRFVDDGGQGSLAAYVVPATARAPDAAELRAFLRNRLPAYMLPVRYVVLERMPLSANGKIDRKALPTASDGAYATAPAFEPPVGEWEIRLADLWADVLGIDQVGAEDDFQDLGGHSLRAARLMGQIARTFGVRLPLATLLHAPTLRAMAAVISGASAPNAPPDTVVIQDGALQPLFWIDAVPNLRPGLFRALGRALGSDRPLVGVPIDLDRNRNLHATRTLADVAAELVAKIRAHRSGEPYLIGGWCNGGCLAYEVAAQLLARGAEVALLALLDTANPAAFRTRRARIGAQVQQLRTLPHEQRWSFAADVAGGYLSRFRRRHQRDKDEASELLDLNDRFGRLVNAYDARPLAAPVVLFQPVEGQIDYRRGWLPVLGERLEVCTVAGGHVSVLDEPHVGDLGRQLADRLGRADAMRGYARAAE